ncbi:MAG TPA: DUF2092 domain-containing protein [Pseudomonadales bacterium]|nr:DUF2092 domain-containing protein [Pseudomonadales bacterium]
MKRKLIFLQWLAAVILVGGAVTGQAASTGEATEPPVPDARAVLQKMARQLAQAPGYSVTIFNDYDAIQQDGQSITFRNKHQVSLQRPGQLRIDATRSDGDRDMTLFDGKTLTTYKEKDNVYARVEKPGTVDNTVVYMVQDLQMVVPLARLLLTTLPQELDSLVLSAHYVEKDVLSDTPADHIVVSLSDVDVQLWVVAGEQSLPRKIIITYKHARGQPQFRAEFVDWNLAPVFKPESFVWTPPKGAEQIPFLAPVRQTPAMQETATEGVAQ